MKRCTIQESINALYAISWKRRVSFMGYQFKFEKIMKVKEREKDEVLSTYNESVKRFEEAAEKLFRITKEKRRSRKLSEIKLRKWTYQFKKLDIIKLYS